MVKYYQNKLRAPLTYIYNGISPKLNPGSVQADDIEKIQNLKSKYSVIGISANLIYRKGIDKIISLLAVDGAKQFALLVIGDGGEKDELLLLADKLGVSNRCLFLGYRKNAIDYYKYFDVYMMSSRSEGFGLCVIEAASQKIPVTCNDLPVYRELFKENEVVRFNLENEETIIVAIETILKNSKFYSDEIFKNYSNTFTALKMAENYLSLYLNS
jgi:L-malate glycosyltransferase